MVEELRNFIGGQWTDMAFDKRSELIDPSTGEVFATAPISSETEVDAAVSSAAAAFEGWRDTTPAERSLALLRIADAIEARADEFVKAESQNTGKPVALTLPVIDTICGTGWAIRARPVSRSPVITLKTPGGRNSLISSAMSSEVTGVVSDGLSTMVLPAARAGAHFQTPIIIG